MFRHNFFTYSGKIVFQILGQVLYFPIWWYSTGFLRQVMGIWNFWRQRERTLGLSVWIKNIFVPMYGQRDIASRIISFIIRLVQIVFRAAILFFWFLMGILFLIIWLFLPLALFLATSFQFIK
jgi:hypothetical protein